ncbi:hypothetical protein AAHC03_016932 [Spirometra sp. Aus1]
MQYGGVQVGSDDDDSLKTVLESNRTGCFQNVLKELVEVNTNQEEWKVKTSHRAVGSGDHHDFGKSDLIPG